jgi:AMP deaminase
MLNVEADDCRIERYTAMATPTTVTPARIEQHPYPTRQPPASPTFSMKTNASLSTVAVDSGPQPYQQFPAQAARIPASHSQVQLDTQQSTQANGSPLQHATSREQTYDNTVMASPHLTSMPREPSWPVESFGDLHLSGSEPRIFPGIVSRTQRRDSLVRKSSMSETDEHGGAGTSRKGGNGRGRGIDGAVEEVQESDGEMEEAGGLDE